MTPLVPYDATLQTYTFFGDSQASTFDGLLLRQESSSEPVIRTKALWLPGLRSRAFFAGQAFDETFTRMLWALHVLRPSAATGSSAFARPPHRVFGDEMDNCGFDVRVPERVLVACVGICDVLDVASESAGAGVDEIATKLEMRLAPLFAGLCALRDAGCRRLYLHELPLPARAPDNGYPLALLHQVAQLANAAFASFCASERIGFIDSWSRLKLDATEYERFFNDELHLNRDGTLVVLNRLHELVTSPQQALDSKSINLEG